MGTSTMVRHPGLAPYWPHVAGETQQQLLQDFLDHFISLKFSPHSQRGYRLAVSHFLNAFPHARLEAMTSEQIERHLEQLTMAPSTKRSHLLGLRAFFRFLVERGVCRRNPCELQRRFEDGARLGLHADLLAQYQSWLARQHRLGHVAHEYQIECVRVVRTFLQYSAHVAVKRMTPEHIERFLTDVGRHSHRTMATDLMKLRTFFRWAQDEQRLVRENPAARVRKPRWSSAPRRVVTAAEFSSVCRACRTLEEITIVEVLYYTGLRVGEFCRLQRARVDLDQRLALVLGKGRRENYVFFPPHVTDLLRAHIAGSRPSPWVFLAPRRWRGEDRPPRPDGVNIVLHRLGREAGLSYVLTAHLLRHGLAWALKISEMPLAAIQQVMRHTNIQTTIDLYGRLQPRDVQALYDKYMPGRDSSSG